MNPSPSPVCMWLWWWSLINWAKVRITGSWIIICNCMMVWYIINIRGRVHNIVIAWEAKRVNKMICQPQTHQIGFKAFPYAYTNRLVTYDGVFSSDRLSWFINIQTELLKAARRHNLLKFDAWIWPDCKNFDMKTRAKCFDAQVMWYN